MELKPGTIVKYNVSAIWVQYVSIGDIGGCIIYDGESERYASVKELSGLPLPIGLTALGFIDMEKDNPAYPNTNFYRKGNMEISENVAGEFFIEDKEIKFTSEAQDIFNLFDFLPKDSNRRLK